MTHNPRRARPGSEYGLVRRVARKHGWSEGWVSLVKCGFETSRPVTDALVAERKLMRTEQRNRARRTA